MKKFGRALVLMSALALVAGTTSIDAQDKKAPDTKKGTTKVSGSIEVYKNEKGKWRYKILNDEGKTIAMPLPQLNWETKAEAEKAVDELKTILNTAKPAEPKAETKPEKK